MRPVPANGHKVSLVDIKTSNGDGHISEPNLAFVKTVVPIDDMMDTLLSRLSPRTVKQLLTYYAAKLDEII